MRVAERVLDVDSTLTGENVRMGIDEAAIQHIIGVLTDLYSDPELAVIREYSTNALDAHREAGNSAPIEVTTPTNLAPFFRVKDYGIGLDAEGIRNIYSKYGMSTKRDSNEQVGMLGLGCKSALTYTDQFTLIGTKDGRQVQVQIGRDEDGGGSMTIVSDAPSDAPNGVEVIVPAKRENDYEEKAKRFFRFWNSSDVLLNGEPPQTIAEQANPTWLIEDELFVFDPAHLDETGYNRYRDTYSPGWVVMGGVPYPLPEESGMRNRKYRVVAFVDIGEVNFTPSREALMLTKLTKGTLARIEADVQRELVNATQKQVAEAPTPADAIRLTQQAAAMGVKTAGITYKGREVPTKLERTMKIGEYSEVRNTYLMLGASDNGYSRRRKNGERFSSIPPYNSSRIVFTGYESKELTPVKREKIDKWLTDNSIDRPREFVLVDKLTPDERFWLTGTPIYDWSPVQEVKLEKSGTVGPSWKARPRGSYEQPHYHGGGHIEADQIDTSKPILYVPTDERYLNLTDHIPADATVLVMPNNRLEKFLRDFPSAMEWREYVRKEAKNWLDQQDPAQVEIAKYHLSGVGTVLTVLDPDKVNDPELAAAIRKQHAKVNDLVRGIEQRKKWLTGFDRYELASKYDDPLKKYPLLRQVGIPRSHTDHVYLYINAAYAA